MATIQNIKPTPEKLVADLILLLDLEPQGGDRFVGRRHPEGIGRVFGGQAIAQALRAARRTVEDSRIVHSLHAYFLRPGSDALPIEYRVKRDLDGRSFSNRRVVASQDGKPILNLTASFQKVVEGPSHQHPVMPDVPPPEELVPDSEIRARMAESVSHPGARHLLLRPQPIDFRSVERRNWLEPEQRDPLSHVWFRTVAPIPSHSAMHRAILSYISDFEVLATALHPFGKGFWTGEVKAASLDHTIWFHEPFLVDDWLLYVTDSPWSGHGRGFARGQVFSRDGRLVASVMQEGMVRHLNTRS